MAAMREEIRIKIGPLLCRNGPPSARADGGIAPGEWITRSEVPGHHQLRVARRLPAGTGAIERTHLTGVALVALAHVDHFLVVEQVEHREPGLEVDAFHRQRPGHVCAEVVGPRHAPGGTTAGVLVDPLIDRPGTVRCAVPEGAAARAF